MWTHHVDHVKEYLPRCSTSENGEQKEEHSLYEGGSGETKM